MDGVGHEVRGILGGGICEGGDVQFNTAAITTEELAAVAATACGSGDHGVDVVDVALVILCDGPAELRLQIGVCLIQRDRNDCRVFFLSGGDCAVLVLYLHGAGSCFGGVEALHESVCRTCGGCILPRAESIKNGLDSYRVKAVAAVHLPVGRGHRRIQKRKGCAHLLDVMPELCRDFRGVTAPIEGCGYCLVIMVSAACCQRADDGYDEDEGRQHCHQYPANAFTEFFVG